MSGTHGHTDAHMTCIYETHVCEERGHTLFDLDIFFFFYIYKSLGISFPETEGRRHGVRYGCVMAKPLPSCQETSLVFA